MKTRNKLILSATAMLALSMGAMITGTVAWFTATRQATVNLSNVKVVSTQGDLQVELVGTPYTVDTSVQGTLGLTGTDVVTDVSSNGITFYKPAFYDSLSTQALYIDDVTAEEDHFVDFQLTISRSDPTNTAGFLVYLGANSVIEAYDELEPADVAAANSARVSILNQARDARKFLWAPVDDETSYSFIEAGTGPIYGVSGYDLADAELESDFHAGVIATHTGINGTNDGHTGGDSPVIADLTTAGSEVITVRIWIEGTDSDCTNDAKNGFFTLTLDLYALGL